MSRSQRGYLIVACLLACLSGAYAQSPARQYAPDRKVDIKQVTLDVLPDFHQHTVSGNTRIDFAPIANPLDVLTLNADNLDVVRVTSDHTLASWTLTDKDLTLSFIPSIPADQNATVQIWYTAEPNKGLYFRTPENGYPAQDTLMFSQGEAHEAPHWFPNYDYPNERFTSDVICQVPADMTVLSNGRKLSETFDPNTGLKAVHWRQDKPHVNYLIALAAGYFKGITAKYRDIPLGFYVPASQIDLARNSFKDTADMMAFYEQETGVPYPWDSYNQVAAYDFVAGGMENTTLTILTDRTLHPEDLEPIHSSTMLVAHELAHQWFGDYVTCKDWSHVWLNEGFATYFAHLYDLHQKGRDKFLYGLYRDAGTLIHRHGILKPVVDRAYARAMDQFDSRAYQKGSWVLHMLRSQLGDKLFRHCLQTYLQRHALGTVETTDLRQVFEELSGRSFDRFFDQWLDSPGLPHLDIDYQWSPTDHLAHVTIKQSPLRTNDKDFVWTLPSSLRFWVQGKTIDHKFTLDQAVQDIYVALPAEPNLVRFDPNYTLLADVRFHKSRPMLYAQLAHNDDIIGQLFAIQALRDQRDLKTVAHLKQTLNQAPYYAVRAAAADALQAIHTDEAFNALVASRDQSQAQAREAVVRALGHFYRPAARSRLLDIIAHETEPDIAATALTQLGRFDDPNVQATLTNALHSKSFRQIRLNGALGGILQQKDKVLVPDLLDTLKQRHDLPGRVTERLLRTLGACGKNLEDKTEVRQPLCQWLNHRKVSIRESALAALGTLGDPKAAPVVETFTQTSGPLGKAAKSALEKIRQKDTHALPREITELRQSVEKLQKKDQDLEKKLRDLDDRLEAVQKQ